MSFNSIVDPQPWILDETLDMWEKTFNSIVDPLLDSGVVIDVYDIKAMDVFYKPKVRYPYEFFTYVYASDLDPSDMDLEKIIRGMGFLKAILRHKYGIPIDTIGYSFEFFSKL